MSSKEITFCDKCNKEQSFVSPRKPGEAFFFGSPSELRRYGWELRGVMYICAECIKREIEKAEEPKP